MRISGLFILFFMGSISAAAQREITPYAGMADADLTVVSPWTLFSNQAGLAENTEWFAAASLRRVFGLAELDEKNFLFVMPLQSGNFATAFGYAGYEHFNRKDLSLGYGKKLFRRFNVGFRVIYTHIYAAKRSHQDQFVRIEGGGTFYLSETWRSGIHVTNPFSLLLKISGDKVEEEEKYAAGISWLPDDVFTVAVKTEYRKNRWLLSAGVAFHYRDFLEVRCGAKSEEDALSAGLSITPGMWEISFNYENRKLLGNTVGITCGWKIKERKDEIY